VSRDKSGAMPIDQLAIEVGGRLPFESRQKTGQQVDMLPLN